MEFGLRAPWIVTGERFLLPMRPALMGSVSSRMRMKKVTAFRELESELSNRMRLN
jgi:hypothetical protein